MTESTCTLKGTSCHIRRATAADVPAIRRLMMSASVHAAGLNSRQLAGPRTGGNAAPAAGRSLLRRYFFRAYAFLFSPRVPWRQFSVAVTGQGAVIGCCRVKPHRCGIRELSSLAVAPAWRNGIAASRLLRFVYANSPLPLWGTCMDRYMAFHQRNGAVPVVDQQLMPPFLRRRQRFFNVFLRLAGKTSFLAVMAVTGESLDGQQGGCRAGAHAAGAACRQAGMQGALLRRIAQYQSRRTRPFVCPGFYEAIQGLFVSYPTYTVSLLRKYFCRSVHLRVPDNNAFVTFWTLELLLEACAGHGSLSEHISVEHAVTALLEFHDRTRSKDDPLFVFWRQHEAGGHPTAFPANLMPFYRLFMLSDKAIQKMTNAAAKIRPAKRIRSGGHAPHGPKRSAAAFSLPADFDDAALNWSLGSCLSEDRARYPGAWAAWSHNRFDFTRLARHAVDCAYRPFTGDPDAAAIDPRTFYAMSPFLWELKDSGRDLRQFSLLTTWASTLERNRAGMQCYYKMPFNVNNLDCSVQANFLHAACRAALGGRFPHAVRGFCSLIADTAQYLAWAVASGTITGKPDIALLYYPTSCCAFFFISRIVQLLEKGQPGESAAALLASVGSALVPAARRHITQYLQSCAVQTGSAAYWERRPPGRQAASPRRWGLDDRKFLTAAAVNSLFNLWTCRREGALRWLPAVPDAVPGLVHAGLAWLREHGLSRFDHNAFFSASVKHASSLPFLFPANRVEHVEGPALQPRIAKQSPAMVRHSVYAMVGVPSREEYGRMLAEKNLAGAEEDAFAQCYALDYPYWSAPSVTCALVCLAFANAGALKQ